MMQYAPPVDALLAAGVAVLAQLEQEALVMRQVGSQLTAMRRDHQELEKMGAAQVQGQPEEAVRQLDEAGRSVKKLRRQLGRHRFGLEEAIEAMEGYTQDAQEMFPELMWHVQQAELLALWRPDQDLEETFVCMAIHPRVGARHRQRHMKEMVAHAM
ncbi:hypothetical protein CYMTET_18629 [Cymbomonas tetramitiformis]|uniref:Uncharacterized protein n=1 Tax=Cymbomonas tetramitiformis TaxID=36881 RepID=A0AAE0G7X6_9CHLO|nr:hypothetical protein CYMTET_18629 [Cymbomonas tetramitiformis]